MKKVFLFVVFAVLLAVSAVSAQNGIEIIGRNQESCSFEALYDAKVGTEYEINGLGLLKVVKYEVFDEIYNSTGYRSYYDDGKTSADSTVLFIDITNLTFTPKNYLEGMKVKAVYNNIYEINGWWCQRYDSGNYVYEEMVWPIDPFYQGHYKLGVSIPDYIMKDTRPLRMEIAFGNVELVYHIRK